MLGYIPVDYVSFRRRNLSMGNDFVEKRSAQGQDVSML